MCNLGAISFVVTRLLGFLFLLESFVCILDPHTELLPPMAQAPYTPPFPASSSAFSTIKYPALQSSRFSLSAPFTHGTHVECLGRPPQRRWAVLAPPSAVSAAGRPVALDPTRGMGAGSVSGPGLAPPGPAQDCGSDCPPAGCPTRSTRLCATWLLGAAAGPYWTACQEGSLRR